MAFEELNRAGRRAAKKYAAQESVKRPAHLTEIPNREWPIEISADFSSGRLKVWQSRSFLVQMFSAPQFQGIECRRLSVNRVTLGVDGHWDQNISWDDLYAIKAELGFSDWYGIEIYPPKKHLVNVANMRHLWLLREPIPIGWIRP